MKHLSHEDACYLSRVFNESRIPGVGIDRDTRINDWLKAQIVEAHGECPPHTWNRSTGMSVCTACGMTVRDVARESDEIAHVLALIVNGAGFHDELPGARRAVERGFVSDGRITVEGCRYMGILAEDAPATGIETEGQDAQRLGAKHESPVPEGQSPD